MAGSSTDAMLGPLNVNIRVDCSPDGSDTEVSINGRHYGRHYQQPHDPDTDGTDCLFSAACTLSCTVHMPKPLMPLHRKDAVRGSSSLQG